MRVNFLIIMIMVFLLTLGSVTACGPRATKNDKITVAVSIVPQATFVKEIAGDLVETVTMIPPGSSPETYSPSPRQLETFSRASLYFTMDVPSETANILPKAKDFNKDLKIIRLAEKVSQIYPDIEFAPGNRDPHIWLSPKRVKVMIDIMAEELSILDPDNKSIYVKNAEGYKEKLDKLDEKIRGALEGLKGKTFIAYHPAFGYFAEDYGLEMLALEEEGKEATPKSFESLIDTAKSKGIKVIFYQAEVDSRQSQAFAKEIGGRTEQIAPLAPNYIENLEKMADTFLAVLK